MHLDFAEVARADLLRSTAARLAYRVLMELTWRNGSLPGDDATLARLTGLTAAEWRKARPELEPHFLQPDGSWLHPGVLEARQHVEDVRGKRKDAADQRWGKTRFTVHEGGRDD
jgi:uncharacterized protein YdaU (DUF1376 family)